MAQRRFGPTRGAGTVIIELEGQKTIEAGALGWCGYAGILEKGPVGELIQCSSKSVFNKRCGSIIDDTFVPDCCEQYFDVATGAGGLMLVRVTTGNEVAASATLYARNGDILTPMGTLAAHNGGRWGGKKKYYTNDLALLADLTDTTLDTKVATFEEDQWKGGYIELSDVANTQYPITGNTAAGVITVASDQTMLTDHSGGADLRYYLVLENEDKAVSYKIEDSEDFPDTDFALSIYVDGDFVKKYPNLNCDPDSPRYWIDVIDNDSDNYEIEVTDLWTGAYTADVRPANIYGKVATATATLLTADIHDLTINSPVAEGNPTIALGTLTSAMMAQTITVTMTGATTATVASDKFGDLGGTVTLGALYTPNNKWSPPFTITAGATPLIATDTLVIHYKPFIADSLIDGYVYPDKPNSKLTRFRIIDNDHNTITVAAGSDMTTVSTTGDYFLVEAPLELAGGIDGNAGITDANYTQQAWDVSTSPFNQLAGKNLGLVKMATPGVTSTAIQQAGKAYVEAKNLQYRYEIPSGTVTDTAAITYINETIGRSDFCVVAFPSYGYVVDPDDTGEGKRKLVPLTGQIHGREAVYSRSYEGYHKAQAGTEATLPAVLDITTGTTILNEELLNPTGIAVIKKLGGNFVIWGDRMLAVDPTWKWKHQREQMSHYERVLGENFDWIIFSLNDDVSDAQALFALQNYFYPEWKKRALRGDDFLNDAVTIRADQELNTDATREAGDKIAEVKLRLSATTERMIIRIGKQGIFESVA